MISDAILKELDEKHAKATIDRAWTVCRDSECTPHVIVSKDEFEQLEESADRCEFIVALVNAYPQLVAELRAARQEQGWQDIATAPFAQRVLVTTGVSVAVAYRRRGEPVWWFDGFALITAEDALGVRTMLEAVAGRAEAEFAVAAVNYVRQLLAERAKAAV